MSNLGVFRRAVLTGLCLAAILSAAPAPGQGLMVRGRAGAPTELPTGLTGKGGLHIPTGKQVQLNPYNLTDSGGYIWDLQYYLGVNNGTNSIYSGGMYLQVGGQQISSNGVAWTNAAGDEVEIGPWNRGGLQVYRRCRVYRDVALARWMDIFVNTGPDAQNVQVRVYSCTNNTVAQTLGSSGGNSFGEKDWAFITDHQQGRPSLLHVVCGPKSKLRPGVQVNQNNIYVNYNLTVPAGQTAVLVYWESQGQTVGELQERMRKLQLSKLLSDLSPATRKLIVNLGPQGDADGIELERSGASDCVLRNNEAGDAIFGTIANDKFTLEAFYGRLELPAADVIGFVSVPGADDTVRAVLSGGQVMTGKLKSPVLKLNLPIGGSLDIPFAKIRQCSYRVSKEKPEDSPLKDALIVLRSGDRLAFDAAALKCTFQSRHGQLDLSGKDLVEIRLDHDSHGVHRALFLNGSTLGGILGPERITLKSKLGPTLNISRDMVKSIRFAEDTQDAPAPLTRLSLSNEDELFGKLVDDSYGIVTEFNAVTVKPVNILAMAFDPQEPALVAVRLWDSSTLRGRLKQDTLKFQITPGPTLAVNIGQIFGVECPAAQPADEITLRVEKYIALLSASGYKDRQEAQEALVGMGRTIIPLLQRHLKDNDPEVRQRLTAILEQLGGATTPPAGAAAPGGGWVQPMGLVRFGQAAQQGGW